MTDAVDGETYRGPFADTLIAAVTSLGARPADLEIARAALTDVPPRREITFLALRLSDAPPAALATALVEAGGFEVVETDAGFGRLLVGNDFAMAPRHDALIVIVANGDPALRHAVRALEQHADGQDE